MTGNHFPVGYKVLLCRQPDLIVCLCLLPQGGRLVLKASDEHRIWIDRVTCELFFSLSYRHSTEMALPMQRPHL